MELLLDRRNADISAATAKCKDIRPNVVALSSLNRGEDRRPTKGQGGKVSVDASFGPSDLGSASVSAPGTQVWGGANADQDYA